jgi:hypothetical protein
MELVKIYGYNMNKARIGLIPVYHSSVVVHDKEFSFSQRGIECGKPGQPDVINDVGKTSVNLRQLMNFVKKLENEYTKSTYHAKRRNCNRFTREIINFLCDNPEIPSWLEGMKFVENQFGSEADVFRGSSNSSSSSCIIA